MRICPWHHWGPLRGRSFFRLPFLRVERFCSPPMLSCRLQLPLKLPAPRRERAVFVGRDDGPVSSRTSRSRPPRPRRVRSNVEGPSDAEGSISLSQELVPLSLTLQACTGQPFLHEPSSINEPRTRRLASPPLQERLGGIGEFGRAEASCKTPPLHLPVVHHNTKLVLLLVGRRLICRQLVPRRPAIERILADVMEAPLQVHLPAEVQVALPSHEVHGHGAHLILVGEGWLERRLVYPRDSSDLVYERPDLVLHRDAGGLKLLRRLFLVDHSPLLLADSRLCVLARSGFFLPLHLYL
mmetsp:Transcript_36211/g.81531  ORF Transcript_36211/g.81531 Transcript_36211/m.81531 type:complete len:297 (+) Transcript_36211:268-1158(+)